MEKKINKELVIRLEKEDEYFEVEKLVRECFYDVYRPKCLEHYVLHCLRNDPDFVKELDFVLTKDNKIIGQVIFVKSHIYLDDGQVKDILTMGPICIDKSYQKKGYGKYLLGYSIDVATKLGYKAILIEGDINFYKHSGFEYAKNYHIKYNDFDEKEDTSFFLCKILKPGYLDNIKGTYITPKGYFVSEEETNIFDQKFI